MLDMPTSTSKVDRSGGLPKIDPFGTAETSSSRLPPPFHITLMGWAGDELEKIISIEALNRAWEAELSSSSHRLVLIALANAANPETGESFPSWQYLEKKTCLNRKTIGKVLNYLRTNGFIEDTGKRRGVTKSIIVYKIISSPKIGSSPKSGQEAVPILPGSSTNLGIQNPKEPKGNPKKERPPVDNLNQQAWDEYEKYRAENKIRKLKPMSVYKLQSWLASHSLSDQQKIVDQSIQNGWTGLFELKKPRKQINSSQDKWVGMGTKIGITPKRGESMQSYMRRVQEGIDSNG